MQEKPHAGCSHISLIAAPVLTQHGLAVTQCIFPFFGRKCIACSAQLASFIHAEDFAPPAGASTWPWKANVKYRISIICIKIHVWSEIRDACV